MNRREVIAGLALPLFSQTVRAQDRKEATIGFLSSRSPDESASVVAAFRKGLSEAGFVEGQNVRIVFRWAEGRYEQLPALAADLVGQGVVLIFAAGGPPAALAAKAATATIPIVFSAASDPVGIGLVQSLNRPGGNITGMSTLTTPLGAKSVELFKELKPSATVFAYLLNKSNPSADGEAKMAIAGASELGVQLHVLGADSEQGLEEAFELVGGVASRGSNRCGRAVLRQPPREDRCACGAPCRSRQICLARIRVGWRADKLRHKPDGLLSPSGDLRGPDSEGRKASRSAGSSAGHLRACDQPQDR